MKPVNNDPAPRPQPDTRKRINLALQCGGLHGAREQKMVREPLIPDGSGQVHHEWINMSDSRVFGAFQESGLVIPCLLNGEPVNYSARMFLNDEPPISAGLEIWGFPKRWGEPKPEARTDTLTGTLHSVGERVAIGTKACKYQDRIAPDPAKPAAPQCKTTVNLKILSCVGKQSGGWFF